MRQKRKGFVRTRISRTETVISFVVLLFIVGTGVAIYIKGQIYNSSLFSFNPYLLSKYPPVGPQLDPPVSQQDGESKSSPAMDTRAPSPSGLLDGLAPPGWRTLGDVTQFNAATLFEKIDGRADQYLDYKFVSLTCVSLASQQDKSQFIDIYVFDMGRPTQAFGVFSVERSDGLPAVALGREGYRAEASYFFWKGRYYVQVLASNKGTKLAEVNLNVARTLEKRLKDDGEPIWGLTALPETDRIPGTVQYFVTDAMSLDFMKETYIAQYRKEGAKIMTFLSKQSSPDVAVKTLTSYEDYLKKYGKVVGRQETDLYTLVTGDMGGTFDVVFRKGVLIGGVSMVESRSIAEKAALDLLAALRDKH